MLVTHDMTEVVVLASHVVLIEDGRTTPDERVDLPHPRHHSLPALVWLEEAILDHVMQCKSDPDELTDVHSHTA